MIATFAKGNLVQTLVISILLGIAILKMKNQEHKATMKKVFEAANSMIFSLIGMIMQISPIGIFFLMGSSLGMVKLENMELVYLQVWQCLFLRIMLLA